MPQNSSDKLRALLNEAFPTPDRASRPSAAFVDNMEAGLRIAALELRHRRIVRQAIWFAVAGIAFLCSVATLFWYAVDVPAALHAHAPGLLGRIDAALLAAEQHAWALYAAGFATVLALPALAIAAFRRRARA